MSPHTALVTAPHLTSAASLARRYATQQALFLQPKASNVFNFFYMPTSIIEFLKQESGRTGKWFDVVSFPQRADVADVRC